VLAVLPIAWGTVAGDVHGQAEQEDLAGPVDPRIKLSIGLRGATALTPADFAGALRPAVVGASLTAAWKRSRAMHRATPRVSDDDDRRTR